MISFHFLPHDFILSAYFFSMSALSCISFISSLQSTRPSSVRFTVFLYPSTSQKFVWDWTWFWLSSAIFWNPKNKPMLKILSKYPNYMKLQILKFKIIRNMERQKKWPQFRKKYLIKMSRFLQRETSSKHNLSIQTSCWSRNNKFSISTLTSEVWVSKCNWQRSIRIHRHFACTKCVRNGGEFLKFSNNSSVKLGFYSI